MESNDDSNESNDDSNSDCESNGNGHSNSKGKGKGKSEGNLNRNDNSKATVIVISMTVRTIEHGLWGGAGRERGEAVQDQVRCIITTAVAIPIAIAILP